LKKYKHPSVTYSIKKYNGDYDIQPLRKKMKRDIEAIVNHYKLDSFFNWIFFLLITHNAFIETQPKDLIAIKFAGHNDTIKLYAKYYKDPIGAIFLLNNVTKTQLKKWIDENWDDNMWQSLRYHMPILPNEKGTYSNAIIDNKIAELKKNGKTNEEISKILSSEFPENENVYDVNWISTRFFRYSKKNI
jgi:hypothetical protein